MFPQDLYTLVASTMTNRSLQWCADVVHFETKINPFITQELSQDGGVVLPYCPVQCGGVVAVLNIHIYPLMVHQRNHHIQMVAGCCVHQCCGPVIFTCIHIVDHAENSVEERETAAFLCSHVQCIHPIPIDFIGVGLAVQQCLCRLFILHIDCRL